MAIESGIVISRDFLQRAMNLPAGAIITEVRLEPDHREIIFFVASDKGLAGIAAAAGTDLYNTSAL